MSSFVIHLLRHGAPVQSGLLLGHSDMPSSAEGIAACVGQSRSLSFAGLIASDLARAAAPARIIGQEQQLPPILDARWRELDFGQWDGLCATQVDADALATFHADPDRHVPPGGERWSDLKTRIADALHTLTSQDWLIISHGGAMRATLSVLCGFDQAQLWAFDLPYAACLSLRIWDGPRRHAQIIGLKP